MIAYFDCFAGISGDMLLGAFIHLGVPLDFLETELDSLFPPGSFKIETGFEERMGVYGCRVNVITQESPSVCRDYTAIKSLIEQSSLSDFVKEFSLKAFKKLAEAEAKIHKTELERVHFHELGGVDAIVDIVGSAICIKHLGIDKITASRIPTGTGFVRCSHGLLPVPAPAALEILSGIPTYGTDIPFELVTPTGALLVKCAVQNFGPMPPMTIERVGYGVGSRSLEQIPNLLRVILGRAHPAYLRDQVTIIETNIDDMNPEIFGFIMEELFKDGALDVWFSAVTMKKNRPGVLLHIVCEHADRDRIVNRTLNETTTSGVRYYESERIKLQREIIQVKTEYGELKSKRIIRPDGSVSIAPEYEDCKKIAIEKSMSLQQVYKAIERAASQN
ncbi:MAG: nickel pincer cofactor biosynthesis protein LarC [Pseudomonadota bacterium]